MEELNCHDLGDLPDMQIMMESLKQKDSIERYQLHVNLLGVVLSLACEILICKNKQ